MIIRRYNWILEKKNNSQDEANLRLRIKWNNSKSIVTFSLGYTINISKWSYDSQRCKANTTHGIHKVPAIDINKRISLYEQIADEFFIEYDSKGDIPTIENIKDHFDKALGKNKSKDTPLFYQYDLYVKEQSEKNTWTLATLKKYKTIKKHLQDFNPNLKINDLNEETLQAIQHFYIKRGYRNYYINRLFGNLTSFIRWLHKKKLYKGNIQDIYKPHLKGADRNKGAIVYLTWEELLKVYNLDLKGSAEQVRDTFCFCCFTSLRYSDVKKLQKVDVKDDYIEVVTQKTNDALKIELNDYSRSILNKYKNINLPNNMALPVISNQKMNMHLKEIAKLAEINEPMRVVYFVGAERKEYVCEKWELISTHCGRRTFVVNALYLGIPSEVIIKWTGHYDYSSMKPYIAIVDKLKQNEMSKFNKK